MVRKAENITAMQAHRQKLIDVLAPTEQALLRSLDGFAVKGRKAQRLDTSDLRIKHFDYRPVGTGLGEDYDNWSLLRSSALPDWRRRDCRARSDGDDEGRSGVASLAAQAPLAEAPAWLIIHAGAS